ncbi:MAG: peroxiredoxin, partial [Elusimicrobia bacterium]|nr:peroxiredoxin [Elusimicrobiota bacterium]
MNTRATAVIVTVFLGSLLGAAPARAALKVGDKAPDVSAPLSDGTTFHLGAWLNRAPLVLYFYPKNNTPGCTKEACGLRDDFPAFQGLKATVIGISYDSVASHRKFIKKYKLPFLLASDSDKKVSKAFGVDGLMFAHRATFVIGRDGTILYVNPAVDPKTHSKELQEVLAKLAKPAP